MEGDTPWVDEQGRQDVISDAMKEKVAGREIKLTIDTEQWHYFEGSPENDEATGAVFYLAAFLDKDSNRKVADLRTELGFGKVDKTPHLTLAGVAPENGDFYQFRQRFCRPRLLAPGATKEPYEELVEVELLP